MDVDTPTKFGHRYKPKIEREREREGGGRERIVMVLTGFLIGRKRR